MTFASLHFGFLLLCTFALYYFLPQRARMLLLLTTSYIFYAFWNPIYSLLILASTLIDYVAARLIESSDDQKERRFLLWTSVLFNLGVLAYFKYTDFALDSLRDLLGPLGANLPGPVELILPLGISFYTFQTMSYTIDVYRKKIKAEKDFILVALYVSFFPQLVAGPIERAADLMPQLAKKAAFSFRNIEEGLRLLSPFVLFTSGSHVVFDSVRESKGLSKRNPFFRRGWYEHVLNAQPKQEGETLIVLISNSQAYGREVSDPLTYPVLIEKELERRRGKPVRVLNWALFGGNAAEYVILGVAAKRLNPDYLLLVSGALNFDNMRVSRETRPSLQSAWATDVYHLLAHPDIRKEVPEHFLLESLTSTGWIDISLGRLWSVWRYRDFFLARWRTVNLFGEGFLSEFDPDRHSNTWFPS